MPVLSLHPAAANATASWVVLPGHIPCARNRFSAVGGGFESAPLILTAQLAHS